MLLETDSAAELVAKVARLGEAAIPGERVNPLRQVNRNGPDRQVLESFVLHGVDTLRLFPHIDVGSALLLLPRLRSTDVAVALPQSCDTMHL